MNYKFVHDAIILVPILVPKKVPISVPKTKLKLELTVIIRERFRIFPVFSWSSKVPKVPTFPIP